MNFAKAAAAKLAEAQKAVEKKAGELDEQYKISEKAAAAKAQASMRIAEVDAMTGASEKAAAASTAVKARASAVDEQFHISEKTAGAAAVVRAEVVSVDQKYKISEQASGARAAAGAKLAAADRNIGVTATIGKATAAVGEVGNELTKSWQAGMADLPPAPSAEELQALGATPGEAKAGLLNCSSGKVCVTGASGFIAMHLVSQLLANGYQVVATVRGPSKTAQVAQLGESFPGKLTVVEGCDLMNSQSFDKAIEGCVGVFHTASPFYPAKDTGAGVSIAGFEELVVPAVVGTRSVLTACQKAGTVKRVVVTASFACILNPANKDYPSDCTYNDGIWNVSSFPDETNVWLQAGAGMHAYRYSKIMAEVTSWQMAKDSSFDVTTINPPLVIGTNLVPVTSPSELNESSLLVYKWLTAGVTLPGDSMAFVDVADVAKAHCLVYESPEAGGNRYLTSAPAYPWAQVAATLQSCCPENSKSAKAAAEDAGKAWTLDTSRLEALGMVFTPAEQALKKQVAFVSDEKGYQPA